MERSIFAGPVLIVGRPRSGTKLLRTLLNGHPQISIPPYETHFICSFANRFGMPARLDDLASFTNFYAALCKTNFFRKLAAEGVMISEDELQKADMHSWASIFEVILRFYGPRKTEQPVIFGDKSPSYLTHLSLLKKIFPEARFIHIIRDPRDCCLSAQKVWGRNILLTAEKWRRDVATGRSMGAWIGKSYLEIHYESLLTDPESVLREICAFLEAPFYSEMMQLSEPSENLGDAKGQTSILSDNRQKYRTSLPPMAIKRIEEIVYPVALACGYELDFAQQFRPLASLQSQLFKVQDALAWSKFHLNEKGIWSGLSYLYRSLSLG